MNFFMTKEMKKEMFVLGACAAAKFLNEFEWDKYKVARKKMQGMINNN